MIEQMGKDNEQEELVQSQPEVAEDELLTEETTFQKMKRHASESDEAPAVSLRFRRRVST